MFLANFADGMREQGLANDRSRKELADAFAQFRVANPHATLAEMQGYIDSLSHGRNYLARGAPSGDVLRSIADANAAAKTQHDTNARLAQMVEQSRVADLIESQVDRALLDNNGDLAKSMEQVRGLMGGDFGSIDPTRYFTPDRWGRIKTKTIQDNYEPAKQWILDSVGDDGKITVTPKQVSDYFGLPEEVAAGILTRAEEDRNKQAAADQRAREQDMRRQRKEALDFYITEKEKHPDRDPRDALSYFFDVDPSQIPDDYIAAIEADSQAALDRAEKERQDKINDRVSTYQTSLQAAISADPLIQAALKQGNTALATTRMQSIIDQAPEDVRDALPQGWGQSIVDSIIEALQLGQLDEVTQRRAAESENAAKIGANVQNASEEFVAAAVQSKLLSGPAIATAAASLARTYYLDASVLPMLNKIAADNPKADPMELTAIVKDWLDATGVPTLAQASAQEKEKYLRSQGAVENPMTFDEWEQSAQDSVTEFTQALQNAFAKAITTRDPNKRLQMLEQTRAAAQRDLEALKAEIEQDEINAHLLLTVGTPRWDRQRAARVVQQLEAALANTDRKIARAMAQAEKDGAVPPPAPGAPGAQSVPGAPAPSKAGVLVDRVADYLRTDATLAGVHRDHKGYGWSWLTAPEDKYDADRFMVDFVRQARPRLMKDEAAAQAFANDPWNWIASSDEEWVQEAIKELTDGKGLPAYYLNNP